MILHLGEFDGTRAFLIIVRHVIYPGAHGIAPHQPSIVGLQQFGDRSGVLHSRIEPEIVVVGIEDGGHPVVDA